MLIFKLAILRNTAVSKADTLTCFVSWFLVSHKPVKIITLDLEIAFNFDSSLFQVEHLW